MDVLLQVANPLLLIELGRINHGDGRLYTAQISLLSFCFIPNATIVVAHSSGEGNYYVRLSVAATQFLTLLGKVNTFHKINCGPFSAEEYDLFFSLYPKPKVSDEFLYSMTLYNPMLLYRSVGTRSELECFKVMQTHVRSYFLYINDKCKIAKPSDLLHCIHYLLKSQSGDILNAREVEEAKASFLGEENILYVTNEQKAIFVFPFAYREYLDMLCDKIINTKAEIADLQLKSAIRGHLFEREIGNRFGNQDLHIIYFKSHNSTKFEGNYHVSAVEFLMFHLNAMEANVLYILQPCHPVIDGVMLTDSKHLLMFQFSLLKYTDHRSKAIDCRTAHIKDQSVLKFYQGLSDVTDPDCIIYVYVAPKSVVKTAIDLKSARSVFAKKKSDEDFCVGIIDPKSDTTLLVDLALMDIGLM